MDIHDEEILELWRLLHENDVAYIMVGGFAVTFHGHSRLTGDVDLWLKDTSVNRQRLRKAIEQLTAENFETIETMQFIPGWSTIALQSGLEIDLMTELKGFEQDRFEDCFSRASLVQIREIPVRFMHYNQLIESKKAAGRTKDLLDIEELERLKKS